MNPNAEDKTTSACDSNPHNSELLSSSEHPHQDQQPMDVTFNSTERAINHDIQQSKLGKALQVVLGSTDEVKNLDTKHQHLKELKKQRRPCLNNCCLAMNRT